MTPDINIAQIWYTLAADQGYSFSQYKLAMIYLNDKNYDKAYHYFKLAAKQGCAASQFKLGTMYSRDIGTPINYGESIKWYQLSANQGHLVAQNNLGYAYFNGLGTVIDYQEARKWYQTASAQGLAVSQYHMGYLFEFGKGVEINYSEVYIWYKLAHTNKQALDKILYFETLKSKIQSTTRSYIATNLQILFIMSPLANMMKYLFNELGEQRWQDPLIKSWLNEVFLEYGCHLLDEWLNDLL